jgi:hypothetical protein
MWCPTLSSRAPVSTAVSFDAPTFDTTDSLVVMAVFLSRSIDLPTCRSSTGSEVRVQHNAVAGLA